MSEAKPASGARAIRGNPPHLGFATGFSTRCWILWLERKEPERDHHPLIWWLMAHPPLALAAPIPVLACRRKIMRIERRSPEERESAYAGIEFRTPPSVMRNPDD